MDNDLIQDTNLDLLQVNAVEVEYSGIAPINVDNQEHTISLDPSALSSKLDTSAFDEWTATHTGEIIEYSAGPNIDITNHVVSGKDWTDEITAASANALNEAVNQIPDVSEFLTKTSADTLYYPLESNPSGYLTAHQDLSDYAKTEDLTAYQPVGDYYSASNPSGFITGVDLSNYYEKNETCSKEEINTTINNLSGEYYPLDNPSGFITGVDLSNYYEKNETSSKEEIANALTAIDNTISGLTGEFQEKGDYYSASNPSGFITGVDLTPYQEKTGMTAYQPVGDYYSASNPSGFITGVDLTDYYKKNETSSKEEISAALTSKLDESAFTAYTATAVQGIEYTGIAPIDVNNTTHEISADVWTLSGTNGISIVEDSENKITTLKYTGATEYYPMTGNPSGFLVSNDISGKQDKLTFAYNSNDAISSINGSALAGGGGSTVSWYTDTPDTHTSADINLIIQTTANIGGRYDRNLLDGNGKFIGALIPSAAIEDLGKVLTITAGSPRWQNLPETPSGAYGIKTEVVANSGLATGQNILYIVTGN